MNHQGTVDERGVKHKAADERNRWGTGSTFQTFKNGRPQWCAVRSRLEDGKRLYIRGFGETEHQAILALHKSLERRSAGIKTGVGKRSIKLSDALDRWLAPRGQKLSQESRRKYRTDITNHVLARLDDRMIHKYSKDDLSDLFHSTMIEEGVGQSAIYHTFINLNTMFNWCVKEEHLEKNPLDRVERPRKSNISSAADREEIEARTDRYRDLLAALEKPNSEYHQHHLLFLFLTLGLRRSEILGLEWSNIKHIENKDKAYIDLNQQLARHQKHEAESGYYIKPETKSGKARQIYLPESYRKAALKHRQEQIENGTGGEGKWSDLIFTMNNKNFTYKNYQDLWVSVWKDQLQDSYEQNYFRPHYVRHIAGSIMLERTNGNLALVQDILGHSDAMMSLHYSHQMEEKRREGTRGIEEGIKVKAKE